MTEGLQFLIEHGYLVLFAWIALDQAGLPLPTLPLLLAAGALAGTGELSLLGIFVVCTLATVPIDLFWFWLGLTETTLQLFQLKLHSKCFVFCRRIDVRSNLCLYAELPKRVCAQLALLY